MPRNRIMAEIDPIRLPQPPSAGITPQAFMMYPMTAQSVTQAVWQVQLYQWALEQALAVARPSLPERDLLGVWN